MHGKVKATRSWNDNHVIINQTLFDLSLSHYKYSQKMINDEKPQQIFTMVIAISVPSKQTISHLLAVVHVCGSHLCVCKVM